MPVGRPRRGNNETCPNCGKTGYSYPVPSWNSRNKNGPRNRYLRFIHADRHLPYCYVDNFKPKNSPLQFAREFNRHTNEVTTFRYDPTEHRIEDVLKRWKTSKALPVIIYSLTYVSEKLKPEIRKLRKSRKIRLTKNELEWLAQQDGYEYLKLLSKNDIVTFGEEAVKVRDKITSSDSWRGEIPSFLDKYGKFAEIQEIRNRNNAIKTVRMNLGHGRTPYGQV